MKKLVSILLAAVMIIGLAACGNQPKESTPAATIPDQTQGTVAPVDNTKKYKEAVTIASSIPIHLLMHGYCAYRG